MLHPVGWIGHRETSADALELCVALYQQPYAGRTEKGDLGKVQPDSVRPAPHHLIEIAAQMLRPIVVEAALDLNVEPVPVLLGRNFHSLPRLCGLRPYVLRVLRRNAESQLLDSRPANLHLFIRYFAERQILRIRSAKDSSRQLARSNSGVRQARSQAGGAASAQG